MTTAGDTITLPLPLEVQGQPVHVGLRVEYRNAVGIEWGVVTSWNDRYVFVKFDGGWMSKACAPWVLRLEGGPR